MSLSYVYNYRLDKLHLVVTLQIYSHKTKVRLYLLLRCLHSLHITTGAKMRSVAFIVHLLWPLQSYWEAMECFNRPGSINMNILVIQLKWCHQHCQPGQIWPNSPHPCFLVEKWPRQNNHTWWIRDYFWQDIKNIIIISFFFFLESIAWEGLDVTLTIQKLG